MGRQEGQAYARKAPHEMQADWRANAPSRVSQLRGQTVHLQPNGVYAPNRGSLASNVTPVSRAVTLTNERNGYGRADPSFQSDIKPSKLTAASFELGMITTTPYFHPNVEMKPKNGGSKYDPHIMKSICGEGYVKRTKTIVLAKFEDHMVALPMYSHESRGIGHKPAAVRAEYMGIKYANNSAYRNDAPYAPMEIEDQLKFELKDTSYIHIVHPVTVKYNCPITLEGSITDESYEHLVKTYCMLMGPKMKLTKKLAGVAAVQQALSKPTAAINPTIVEEGVSDAAVPPATAVPPSNEAVPPSTAGKVGASLSPREIAEVTRKKIVAESTASRKSYTATARG